MIDPKELKSKLDIVEVLTQRGVKLTRKGENFFALCPFHAEDTPSFSVDPKEQLYHCFGCEASGDVFRFVEKQEGIAFLDAVKTLCKLDIQAKDLEDLNREREAHNDTPRAIDRPSADLCERLVTHWQGCLARSDKARKYLEVRGLWKPELLKAFGVGYASGNLPKVLPADGKLRRQLKEMRVLNDKGNEFFYDRIVVPLYDTAGLLVNVYGRALKADHETPHLYLPRPRQGVLNRPGIDGSGGRVILTESVLDALSLVALGFANTTASFGAGGFTADHRAAFLAAKMTHVYCVYDADPQGEQGADQLAHDLAGCGIETLRVVLPCKDPNDFLTSGGTRETFQALLAAAKPIPTGIPRSKWPKPAPATSPASSSTGATPFEATLGDRVYRLEGEPERVGKGLFVVLRGTREGRTHVDTFNLYSDRARAGFVSKLVTAFRGQVARKTLEEDIFSLIDDLEARASAPSSEASPAKEEEPAMSPAAREEALAFLRRLDLAKAILADLTRLGVVGEEDTKLLAYLVATSRKLGKPLSLSVISRSGGGKSFVLNRVADLMPPEEILRYTRISPRALFYDEPGRFKNKILFIEEAIGAREADLGVRSIQSEQRLANLVTMTDPKTGRLRTQENVVEGPITYLTSSTDPLDYETATRSFEVAIDESAEQTARILESQFQERTLSGIQERLERDAVVARHRDAQRLLEGLLVVNELTPQLKFPTDTRRLRREAGKYLSLMEAIALLHQHQRPIKSFTAGCATYRYVEVTPADVDIANRLMAECLTRALSDLPGPAQALLLKIRDYVTERGERESIDPTAIPFSRREVREWIGWSDHQVRDNLEKLVDLEYLVIANGAMGMKFLYTLTPDHRLVVRAGLSTEEKIAALGLTPAESLRIRS